LQEELTRIADTTSFGGKKLLDGTFGSQSFQVGSEANETISMSLNNVGAKYIGGEQIAATLGTTAGRVDDGTLAYATSTLTFTDTASSDTVDISIGANDDAKSIAALVNASSAGVNATATNVAELTATFNGATGLSFTIGGATVTGATDNDSIISQINQNSSTTGVSAAMVDSKLQITNKDGGDMAFTAGAYTGGASPTLTLAAVIDGTTVTTPVPYDATSGGNINGTVSFSSSKEFTTSGSAATTVSDAVKTSTLKTIDSVDISDVAGSQLAIDIIDGAIAMIDSNRADLGA
uniref:flagellin hook IN motif-containing protein n=1 Tax=Shewanella sp. S1-58-MNA-CIBAN-0166 TaxID=3140467 RepID=UPI00331FD4C8